MRENFVTLERLAAKIRVLTIDCLCTSLQIDGVDAMGQKLSITKLASFSHV